MENLTYDELWAKLADSEADLWQAYDAIHRAKDRVRELLPNVFGANYADLKKLHALLYQAEITAFGCAKNTLAARAAIGARIQADQTTDGDTDEVFAVR